jgi:hypothetical protein
MKVGIDYWNTITKAPELFINLASSLISEGHEVHVISAVGNARAPQTAKDIEAVGIPNTAVHVVTNPEGVTGTKNFPNVKLEKCKELGIDMMFDDRKDICELLNANGILALQVTK